MPHLKENNLQFVFSSHYKNRRLATALEAIGADMFRKYTGRIWSSDNVNYHGTYEIPDSAAKLGEDFINADEAQSMAYLSAIHGTNYELLGHETYSNRKNNVELPSVLNVIRASEDMSEPGLPQEFIEEFESEDIRNRFPHIEVGPAAPLTELDPDFDPDVPKRVERVTYLAAHPDMNKFDYRPFTPINEKENNFYTDMYDFFKTPVVGEEVTVFDEKGFPIVIQPTVEQLIKDLVNFRPNEEFDDYNFLIDRPLDRSSYDILFEIGEVDPSTSVPDDNDVEFAPEITNLFPIDEIDRYNYFLDDYEFLIATKPEIPEQVLPNIYLMSLVATDNVVSEDLEEIIFDDDGNPFLNQTTYKDSETNFDRFITLDGFIQAADSISKATMKEYYKQYAENYTKVTLDFADKTAMAQYWTSANMKMFDESALFNTKLSTIPYYTMFRIPRRVDAKEHLWPSLFNKIVGEGGLAFQWDILDQNGWEYLWGDIQTSLITALVQKLSDRAEYSAILEDLEFNGEVVDFWENIEQAVHIFNKIQGSESGVPHYYIHHGPRILESSNVLYDVIREGSFVSPVFTDWFNEDTIFSLLESATDNPLLGGVPNIF